MRGTFIVMKSGIYTITNLVNGKIYVGLTANLLDRESQHFRSLRRNVHKNYHLQNAYNQYGEEAFVYEILVECEEAHMASEEHYWCYWLDTHNRERGYNIAPTDPTVVTFKKSKESIEKFRKTMTGHIITEETKKKISDSQKGKIITEETRRKISEAIKGKPSCRKGVKVSEESRRKMSESQKGTKKNFSEEYRKRLSETVTARNKSRKGTKCKKKTS